MSLEKPYDPYSYNPDSGQPLSSERYVEKGYDPYSYNPDSGQPLSSERYVEKGYDPYSYNPDSGQPLSSISPSLEYEHSVLAARYAADEEKREKARIRDEKIEAELKRKAADREASEKFNALPPYKKLYEMLGFYANYLSKSSNIEDNKLSQTIYEGFTQLRNRNFELMDNVFKVLETRAMNDEDLAIALKDWKKIYKECEVALGRKTEFERKKSEYDKVSFFGRVKSATIAFFNVMSGKEVETDEKGKKL